MSYKIELQSNNTDLQNILNTINILPEASVKNTKIINIDWSQDEEMIGWIDYISDGEIKSANYGVSSVEADLGIIFCPSDYSDIDGDYIFLGYRYGNGDIYMVTEDQATVYIFSSGEQQA